MGPLLGSNPLLNEWILDTQTLCTHNKFVVSQVNILDFFFFMLSKKVFFFPNIEGLYSASLTIEGK